MLRLIIFESKIFWANLIKIVVWFCIIGTILLRRFCDQKWFAWAKILWFFNTPVLQRLNHFHVKMIRTDDNTVSTLVENVLLWTHLCCLSSFKLLLYTMCNGILVTQKSGKWESGNPLFCHNFALRKFSHVIQRTFAFSENHFIMLQSPLLKKVRKHQKICGTLLF